jgi:hypothetical protein
MKLSRSQTSGGQKVRYSASAFAEGGAKLDVSLATLAYLTGQPIPIKVRLMKAGKPLVGAKITVHCDIPAVSVGNVMHQGKVTMDELKKIPPIGKDPIALADRKLLVLSKRAQRNILPRKTSRFALLDDGKHGDGKARDGVYAARFTDNRIPGSYTFRIVASNIPAGGKLTTTREWTASVFNAVNVDPKYSDVDVKRLAQTADGWRYAVRIAPKDRFANYLGPGHAVKLLLSSSLGKREIRLSDNIDGTYTKDVLLKARELKAGVKLQVEIDGRRFAGVKKTIRQP